QPAGAAGDWLVCQPTSAGGRNDQPRLCRGRGPVPPGDATQGGGWSTGQCAAVWRRRCAGVVERAAGVSALAARVLEPGVEGALGSVAGGRTRRKDPGADAVPVAQAALARVDHPTRGDTPLRGDGGGAARGLVLHAQL